MTDPATFQVGPLPPGVQAPKTQQDRNLYGQALQFESVFTQHLVDEMMKNAHAGDEDQAGGMSVYNDMINKQLNASLESGGGLGLAGSIYASMKEHAS
jgi:Rod binding domain-containing protein